MIAVVGSLIASLPLSLLKAVMALPTSCFTALRVPLIPADPSLILLSLIDYVGFH